MKVFCVWLKSDKYSKAQATAWCEAHNFKTGQYREKLKDGVLTHHRFLQLTPTEVIDGSYRTLSDDFPDGISVTTCETKAHPDVERVAKLIARLEEIINAFNERNHGKPAASALPTSDIPR